MTTASRAMDHLITGLARLVTGAQARWVGCSPSPERRVYFANHSSHVDFLLIHASLPAPLRSRTRPVAGADYWESGALRRYLIHEVLHGVLVDRSDPERRKEAVEIMAGALDGGDSLILFPEGTRNTSEEVLLPFKSGLFHLATRCPAVDLVPVWMENLGRVLPKGEAIPVPLLCSVTFGEPLRLLAGEQKADFLARTRQALLDLAARAGLQ